jgi:hypothetical protein
MNMKLTVAPVPGFAYSTAVHQFPVDVTISTDAPAEVSSRVDVGAALLTRVGEGEATFGYVRRVLPVKREMVTLTPESPLCMRIDVFEHDSDFGELTAGDYRCDIKAEVFVKDESAVRRVEFQDGFVISLA